MIKIKLSKRLSAAAEFCRHGSFIADVGTDHAYLPIYLAERGIIRGGVVSDINKGPIERAIAHIAEHCQGERLKAVLCDGLSELEGYAPEDIFILGMGGELIARIISDAPFTKERGIRLILQPMTHAELLRKFLYDNGYSITEETLVREEKIYQLIVAEYSGEIIPYNDLELLLGKKNIERRDELLLSLAEHTKRVLCERIRGKRTAGADVCAEEEILKGLEKLI